MTAIIIIGGANHIPNDSFSEYTIMENHINSWKKRFIFLECDKYTSQESCCGSCHL